MKMKKTIFTLVLSFVVLNLFAQTATDYFITTWKTDNSGTSGSTSVKVPINGIFTAIWEDMSGNVVTPTVSGTTYTFASAGTYKLKLAPGDYSFLFGSVAGDNAKLLTVEQWGTNPWPQVCDNAFLNCRNMDVVATDSPIFPIAETGLVSFFNGCTNLVGNSSFNNWNVTNVINYFRMFSDCPKFNQPLENWNMTNALNLSYMFLRAAAFNQSLNNWNTSNFTNTLGMFDSATSFNQPLDKWNMAKNANMNRMFQYATKFNQNLGMWDLSSIGTYVTGVTMENMLDNSGMDCQNYDATLIGWADNPVTPNGAKLGALNRVYSYVNAVTAHNKLTVTKYWTIVGDKYDPACNPTTVANVTKGIGELSLYPNPSMEYFAINGLKGDAYITLLDLTGRVLLTKQINPEEKISINKLTKGVYLVKVNNQTLKLTVGN